MDERRSGEERRNWMGTQHCNMHESRTEQIIESGLRIETLEKKTDTLEEIAAGIRQELASIKRCVERNADKMDAFEKRWDERIESTDGVIAEYRQAMVSINTKFGDITTSTANKFTSISTLMETSIVNLGKKMDSSTAELGKKLDIFRGEYEEFSWFRRPLNEAYKAAPRFLMKWGAIGIGAVIVVLIIIHQIDITRILKTAGFMK